MACFPALTTQTWPIPAAFHARYLQAIRYDCFGSSPDVQHNAGHGGTRIPRRPIQIRTEMTMIKPDTLEPSMSASSADSTSNQIVRQLTLEIHHCRDLQREGAMTSCSHEFLLGSREIIKIELARLTSHASNEVGHYLILPTRNTISADSSGSL
ncbi:hypothetical protein BDZ85DRAFT_6122 [Elsinoe ampelina]|uniref:Uncharacterized protein n=1 Tax=Elsinoe ampelina TaxID=302913 RepID=A0A6A6GPK7_9PEZI|nr:hypothetical protein BDZ85DRAFT_6122 [Elsinoe ampelina]